MSVVLQFRRRAEPPVAAIRLSDVLRQENLLPAWVITEGYRVVGMRRPKIGEYFFCPVRGHVLRCAEDIETRPFVVLEWEGTA